MMEWIQPYEDGLAAVATAVKLTLEFVAVLCVTLGLIASAKRAFSDLRRKDDSRSFVELRLSFGRWLALEFQLAADILATTITPTLESLGELAAIAVIRTFLNYFLRKELEAEDRTQRERQQAKAAS